MKSIIINYNAKLKQGKLKKLEKVILLIVIIVLTQIFS